jgi:uncharacterized protein with NRDE domain
VGAPYDQVLGGRDLQRPQRGIWLGLTKDGRIALLTNFCDEGQEIGRDKSRGAIVSTHLDSPPCGKGSDEGFAGRLIEELGINGYGGFSLLFGHLQPMTDGSIGGLSIISDRTTHPSNVVRIATKPGEVHGLSNCHFCDLSRPKIAHGKQVLSQAFYASVSKQDSREKLVDSLFDVLLIDTFPELAKGQAFDVYAHQMRSSIFIPRIEFEGAKSASSDRQRFAKAEGEGCHVGAEVEAGITYSYGTQKQTVVLVDRSGTITFIERTLYDQDAEAIGSERRFEYQIKP